MDFKQLETFINVCELKSFSKAAKSLYLSQSTISLHIKALESRLGFKVLVRNRSKVELTPAGQLFLQYAYKIYSLMQEAETMINSLKCGASGSLSIVTSHTICNWFLPDLLLEFKQKYPSIEIVLNTAFSPQSVDMVINGKVNFGIIRTPQAYFADSQLVSKLLGSDETLLITNPKHYFNQFISVDLGMISKEPLIVYGKGTNYWPQIEALFINEGLVPKVSMELNDIHSVKLMVKLGMGVAFLPLISIKDELEHGSLTAIRISNISPINRYSFLIYRKNQTIFGAVEKFINFIDNIKDTNACISVSHLVD